MFAVVIVIDYGCVIWRMRMRMMKVEEEEKIYVCIIPSLPPVT